MEKQGKWIDKSQRQLKILKHFVTILLLFLALCIDLTDEISVKCT